MGMTFDETVKHILKYSREQLEFLTDALSSPGLLDSDGIFEIYSLLECLDDRLNDLSDVLWERNKELYESEGNDGCAS